MATEKTRWAAWTINEDEKLHKTYELALTDAEKKASASHGTNFYVVRLIIQPLDRVTANVETTVIPLEE